MARADMTLEIRIRKGTAGDAWLLWCAASAAGSAAGVRALELADAGDTWWPHALATVWWFAVTVYYFLAVFRRSETARAAWRGLTGKKGVKI